LLWQLLDIDALQPSNPHLCRALRMPGVARLSLCQLLQMDPIPVREVAKELWLHDLQEGERLDLPINEPPKRAAEVAQLFNFGIQDILAATLSALYRRVNGPTPNWSALGFLMWQKLPISQTWLPPSTAWQRRNAFTSNMDGIRFLLPST
jgi:hypothetical protein